MPSFASPYLKPPAAPARAGSAPYKLPRKVAMANNRAAEKLWKDGVELVRQGRFADAATAYERAIALAPAVSLYWLNLANVRRKLGDIAEAERCARRAFELDDKSMLACHLLVEMLRAQDLPSQALSALRALHPSVERDVQHYLLEGSVLMSLSKWQDAAVAFLRLLELQYDHVDAYMQLGYALSSLSQYAEAAECFRTVVTLHPDELSAAIYGAHYAAWACDWPAHAADQARMREASRLLGDRHSMRALGPFCLLSMNDDATLHREVASREALRMARVLMAAAPGRQTVGTGVEAYPEIARHARCRIGLLSADFRSHATSMLLVQVLELLDRSRFELILYSHGADDGSQLCARVRAAADEFVECSNMTRADQADRIRADGVSILIDLSGYTRNTRLEVMALRPAPIQVAWLAYPSTTGADFVDYIIGDPVLTPLEHADDFTEKIAQLPVCYEPTDRKRIHPEALTRAECGLPEHGHVFACFNQPYKITEEVFDSWCRILHRVPDSVLWLLVPQENARVKLRAAAEERGIDPGRLVFADFVDPTRYLARLQCADLFLDTFPYGAHTTCSDALWMGLPVLTRYGRSFSSRVAASLLSAVGLPELAVETAEHYENLAVLLATDTQAQQDIRAHLNGERMNLPLFDSPRFTRELEALFERMVGRWKQGLAPAALPAEPLAIDQPAA